MSGKNLVMLSNPERIVILEALRYWIECAPLAANVADAAWEAYRIARAVGKRERGRRQRWQDREDNKQKMLSDIVSWIEELGKVPRGTLEKALAIYAHS